MSTSPRGHSHKGVIETSQMPLQSWLELLQANHRDALFVTYMFPSDSTRDAYLASVDQRTDDEAKWLLRHFLWLPCSFGEDEWCYQNLVRSARSGVVSRNRSETRDRLVLWKISRGRLPRWDGVRWVLDLLPDSPGDAIAVLWAYFGAYGLLLPEGRMHGLLDSIAVIRAKFMSTFFPGDAFSSLGNRQLEYLVAALYDAIGHQTAVTCPKKDGGRDIIAQCTQRGRRELALIEVKHHTSPIGVAAVRALLGVVVSEKATRGVLVTSSRFTRGALSFAAANPSIELIAGHEFASLLAEHFGTRWHIRLEGIIAQRVRLEQYPDAHET